MLHQYSWNSEVETTWISLIGWPQKMSNTYYKPKHTDQDSFQGICDKHLQIHRDHKAWWLIVANLSHCLCGSVFSQKKCVHQLYLDNGTYRHLLEMSWPIGHGELTHQFEMPECTLNDQQLVSNQEAHSREWHSYTISNHSYYCIKEFLCIFGFHLHMTWWKTIRKFWFAQKR